MAIKGNFEYLKVIEFHTSVFSQLHTYCTTMSQKILYQNDDEALIKCQVPYIHKSSVKEKRDLNAVITYSFSGFL